METRPRVLIDTCVLYPTVMREMVLGVAARGAFEPVWSARILEEWARAAIKLGPTGEAQARAEIALLRGNWPGAERAASPSLLAVAVASSADMILTLNAKDFPRQILAEEGLSRADPDSYLHGIWQATPELVAPVADAVLQEARRLSGEQWEMRALLKKARLPRLAKALA